MHTHTDIIHIGVFQLYRKYIKKKLNQFALNPHTYLTVVYAHSVS